MKLSAQYLIAIFITSIVFVLFVAPQAHAESFSWLSGQVATQPNDFLPSPYVAPPQDCRTQKVFIGQISLKQEDVCVYEQDGFRFGHLDAIDNSNPYYSYYDHTFVIGFPNESHMYRVDNLGVQFITIPQSKDLLLYGTANPGSGWNYLYIVRDFASQLKRKVNADLSVSYILPSEAFKPVMHNELGAQGIYVKAKVSSNGVWLVYEGIDGFTRVNLATLESKWFSTYAPAQMIGMWGSTEFAVSDDGTKIATAGRGVDLRVYELSDSCGSSSVASGNHVPSRECPYVSLHAYAASGVNNDMEYSIFPQFDSAGGELSVYALPIYRPGSSQQARWMTMTAHGYSPIKLDYLALGDSYSSGEGDTEINPITKTKYYLFGTDVKGNKTIPTEKCHISSRSYPYLLKTSMYLNDMRMKSVTCSGAVTADVSGSGKYLGQGERLKKFQNIKGLQDQALEGDIPGRMRQVEFVKKYQPAVITLTAGGNDVHFGDVIASCVMPFSTCSYADTDEGKAMLSQAITGLYSTLVKLYRDIHTASPKTKIYVLGYPQFVSDRKAFLCAPNVVLKDKERTMVHEAVVYINEVIKAATQTVGVKYLDIADSLGGHALCGGQEAYVTGVAFRGEFKLLGFGGKSEQEESFHPNAKGHQAIADAIQKDLGKDETLLSYNYCPDISETVCANGGDTAITTPTYFTEASKSNNRRYIPAKIITDSYVQKGSDLSDFTINFDGLEAGSSAHLEVHSKPIDLGTYTIDETGHLLADISIPDNLSAGYHTLHLMGKSTSGEDIDLWQIIEVRGRVGDIDEDGIADTIDACLYVAASGLDADRDGIDDGCDAEIGDIKEEPVGSKDATITSYDVPMITNDLIERNIVDGNFSSVPTVDFTVKNVLSASRASMDDNKPSPHMTRMMYIILIGGIVFSVAAVLFSWVTIRGRS